jgi:hypothetical protein
MGLVMPALAAHTGTWVEGSMVRTVLSEPLANRPGVPDEPPVIISPRVVMGFAKPPVPSTTSQVDPLERVSWLFVVS